MIIMGLIFVGWKLIDNKPVRSVTDVQMVIIAYRLYLLYCYLLLLFCDIIYPTMLSDCLFSTVFIIC